jgi:histidine triad (HIT) family protein
MAAEPGCPFCLDNGLFVGEPLFANNSCYFLGSIDPILPDAGMIIPFQHRATPFELTADEWLAVHDLLQRARAHLAPANPDGYTIGWNIGAVAGQEVMHAHLHVIARFADEPLAGQGLRHHLKQSTNRRALEKP